MTKPLLDRIILWHALDRIILWHALRCNSIWFFIYKIKVQWHDMMKNVAVTFLNLFIGFPACDFFLMFSISSITALIYERIKTYFISPFDHKLRRGLTHILCSKIDWLKLKLFKKSLAFIFQDIYFILFTIQLTLTLFSRSPGSYENFTAVTLVLGVSFWKMGDGVFSLIDGSCASWPSCRASSCICSMRSSCRPSPARASLSNACNTRNATS